MDLASTLLAGISNWGSYVWGPLCLKALGPSVEGPLSHSHRHSNKVALLVQRLNINVLLKSRILEEHFKSKFKHKINQQGIHRDGQVRIVNSRGKELISRMFLYSHFHGYQPLRIEMVLCFAFKPHQPLILPRCYI